MISVSNTYRQCLVASLPKAGNRITHYWESYYQALEIHLPLCISGWKDAQKGSKSVGISSDKNYFVHKDGKTLCSLSHNMMNIVMIIEYKYKQ